MIIRKATPLDTQALFNIYLPYIEQSIVSFEFTPPTLDEFQERISKTQVRYPWLVAEHQGQIIGYAYASSFRERAAYQWTAESSIYLADSFHGKQIEGASPAITLYEKLFEQLSSQGYKQVLGVISLPNPKSVRFHEKLGFQKIGVFPSVGFKHEKWIDVLFMTKFLGSLPLRPPTPISDRP